MPYPALLSTIGQWSDGNLWIQCKYCACLMGVTCSLILRTQFTLIVRAEQSLGWAGLGWVIKSTSIQLGTKILQSWEMIAWHRNPTWFYWFINLTDIYFHYWCILDVPHKISHYLRFHSDISSSQRFSFLKLLRYCPALFIADRDAVTSKSWFTRPIVSELCYDCL